MASLPPGFELDPIEEALAPRRNRRPVDDARSAALGIYPDLEITDNRRDPNSRLGRANPRSWHVRSSAAVDSRAIPNMTFDDYVEGYRRAGYEILEAIDEYANPSPHATAGHWHVVLGGGPEPLPDGFTLDEEQATPAAPATSVADLTAALPDWGGRQELIDDRAARTREVAAAAAPTPQPRGNLIAAEPGSVRPYRPEGAQVMNASADPAVLARLNAAYRQGASFDELLAMAREGGVLDVSPNWAASARGAIQWRDQNPEAGRSHSPFVPGEMRMAAQEDTRPQAELTAHRPGWAESLGDLVSALTAPALGQHASVEAGNNAESLLWWTGVGALDDAQAFEQAQNRALIEGRLVDAAGNHLGAQVSAAGLLPVIGPGARRFGTGARSLADRIAGWFRRSGDEAVDAAGDTARVADEALLMPGGGAPNPSAPPARQPDRLDIRTMPRTGTADDLGPQIGRVAPLGRSRSEVENAPARARDLEPEDVLPRRADIESAPDDIGSQLAGRIDEDFARARRDYEAIDDPATGLTSDGGRVLNTDLARELSDGYRADRSRSADVHEAASGFVKRLYTERLAEGPPPGRERRVLFTAGGTGAGKSTSLSAIGGENAGLIYDTNMNTYASSVDKIEQALASGWNVDIAYTYRDPIEALVNGALPRAERMGRTVPIEAHVQTHAGARRTIARLAERYADDPRVRLRFVDNSHGRDNARLVSLENLPEIDDVGLHERAISETRAAYGRGAIGRQTLRGTLGSREGDLRRASRQGGRRDGAAARGQPEPENAGARLDDAPASGTSTPGPTDAVPPAAQADEALPPLAGNIRIDKLNSNEDIAQALRTTAERNNNFDEARRGVVTNEETQRLASDLGMTTTDLMRRRRGQALNAEQLLASRQMLAASADDVVRLAEKARGGSDVDRLAFQEAWVRHVAIQEEVSGAVAEAGRALQAMRITANSADVNARALRQMVETGNGRDSLDDLAAAILDFKDDPARLNELTRRAFTPTFRDKLFELWVNGLLSGPQTHVVNTAGNTLAALTQIPESLIAIGIGRLRSPTGRAADRVTLSEVGARSVGMVQGAREGLRAAVRTARTGEPSDALNKIEARRGQAIGGTTGDIVRLPGRALMVADEFFRGTASRAEIGALAVRQARKEGLRGDEARERITELIAKPTDEMMERALDFARYMTYQQPINSRLGKWVQSGRANVPGVRYVLPFLRTPWNLVKFAAERSPLAPLVADWRRAIMRGGADRDVAIARMTFGSGVGATMGLLASQGHITGSGPPDRSARNLLMADGWQPYSIRVGDTYYSYRRLDPFATIFGLAADMATLNEHMTDRQRDNLAGTISFSLMEQMKDRTFLQGVGRIIQVIEEPHRNAQQYLNDFVASFVPAIVSQTARAYDPALRDARTLLDRVRSRIPGLSDDLPARRNIWGEEIVRDDMAGPDVANPFSQSTRRNDEVTRELLEAGVTISPPQRRIAGRELTPEEYNRYSQLAGEYLRADAEDLVGGSAWQEMTREERQDAFDRVKRTARRDARVDFEAERPSGLPDGFVADPLPEGFVIDQ